jgi:hypothetical protein
VTEKRVSNSELRLNRLEDEEAAREPEEGILELFEPEQTEQDEDAPLARDDGDE